MKLTKEYIEVISNWWTQLLIDNKTLQLTETNIEAFKASLSQMLNRFDYGSGQPIISRVTSVEFFPKDNPLSIALSLAVRSIGLTPQIFPHGAELNITQNYEIYACKGYARKQKQVALNDKPRSYSFDSSSDSASPKYRVKFMFNKKLTDEATDDGSEYASDCLSSFLYNTSTKPSSSELQTSTYDFKVPQSHLLKRHSLFNDRLMASDSAVGKRQRLEGNDANEIALRRSSF